MPHRHHKNLGLVDLEDPTTWKCACGFTGSEEAVQKHIGDFLAAQEVDGEPMHLTTNLAICDANARS
jgi:hypothetical protein